MSRTCEFGCGREVKRDHAPFICDQCAMGELVAEMKPKEEMTPEKEEEELSTSEKEGTLQEPRTGV